MKKVFLFLVLLLCVACGTGKTERVTFKKATLFCDDALLVTIPISLLEEAIIEDIKWQCGGVVNDSSFKITYIAYRVYSQGGFNWCVQEDPRKFLAIER